MSLEETYYSCKFIIKTMYVSIILYIKPILHRVERVREELSSGKSYMRHQNKSSPGRHQVIIWTNVDFVNC